MLQEQNRGLSHKKFGEEVAQKTHLWVKVKIVQLYVNIIEIDNWREQTFSKQYVITEKMCKIKFLFVGLTSKIYYIYKYVYNLLKDMICNLFMNVANLINVCSL